MFKKYVKPKSVTWWAGLAPALAGLVLLVAEQSAAGIIVRGLVGAEVEPLVLINAGMAAIGIRGAIKET